MTEPQSQAPQGQDKEIQEGKFFAVISYIGFLCIISLVLKKENKFDKYPKRQENAGWRHGKPERKGA